MTASAAEGEGEHVDLLFASDAVLFDVMILAIAVFGLSRSSPPSSDLTDASHAKGRR